MSSIVRIVCKRPPSTGPNGLRLRIMPSMNDVRATILHADGTETEIPGIESIRWVVEGNIAATAVITCCAELDAEAALFHAPPPKAGG